MILMRNNSLLQKIVTAFCSALLFTACVTVKNPPAGKPFVYDNKITVNGNVAKDEKKQFTEELDNYWDDSLRVPKVQKFGFLYDIKSPPVFDTSNISRSTLAMQEYLKSRGFYYTAIKDTFSIDTSTHKGEEQLRTSVNIAIDLGKRITIDSIGFWVMDTTNGRTPDSTLQKITLKTANRTLIKKGKPYTKALVSAELDRLVEEYSKNGFYLITRDNIYAEADTLDERLLKLSLDPLEQAAIVDQAAQNRMEDPKWTIVIKQRSLPDSLNARLKQYYFGNNYYYPDTRNVYYNPDSIILNKSFKEKEYRSGTIRYNEDLFRFRPLREHTFTTRGMLYSDSLYYKSLNAFTQIGSWKEVDAKVYLRGDSLDVHYFLIPAPKQNFTVSLEGSNNTGGSITGGNLLGLATNFSYRNRNVWKQAIQSLTSFRAGVEFNLGNNLVDNNDFVQTQQFTVNHTYSIPRWIQIPPPIIPGLISDIWQLLSRKKDTSANSLLRRRFVNSFENKRTLISLAGSYTNRITFYQLRSLNFGLGYEGTKRAVTYQLKFPVPNVELYKVDTLAKLIELFKNNPFLRNSFRNGNVIGWSGSANAIFASRNNSHISHNIRFFAEESGTLVNLVVPSLGDKIFSYVKLEGEYRMVNKFGNHEGALRFFVGAALPKRGQVIPVFKQYSVGGPNSMRAWGIRQLGLGSSLASDTTTSGYTDRFGDFNIEMNLEYRFLLTTIAGIKVGSALYTDMGNIWNIRNDIKDETATFTLNRLGKDLAIGIGTGLRFDFNYFLFRFDFAYKLKDPARQYNGGWASLKNFEWTDTRKDGMQVKNFALQFGIGLPF